MNNIPTAQTIINSTELPRGYELSNYVIERKLGYGGFGITYLAREIATNRAVVIKENFPQVCSQRHTTNLTVGPSSAENKKLYEWALSRFLDEAKVLIRLSHPGIVPVLTAFNALGTAYYVMPLVEGKEIHKAAPSPQAINEAWLRPVLQKLLEALDYLHGEGLLHRDIKPSNILLREDDSPLLIDFGTARSSDATHTLTRVGSPGFSPSEQFTGRGKNGPWTDLYSLGATCYYLITGEVPQEAVGRLEEDELSLLAERKELRRRFSEDFLKAIDKAMSVSRNARWQSAQEWMNNLSSAQRAREEAERRKKEEARQQAEREALEAAKQRERARAIAEQRAREEAEEIVRRMMGARNQINNQACSIKIETNSVKNAGIVGGSIGVLIGATIGVLIQEEVFGGKNSGDICLLSCLLIGGVIGIVIGRLIGRKNSGKIGKIIAGVVVGWFIGGVIGAVIAGAIYSESGGLNNPVIWAISSLVIGWLIGMVIGGFIASKLK